MASDALARFHEEMATLDGPMVIVTAASDGRRAGCLVGFHTQASIAPPRYLVCLSVANHTYAVATDAEYLAVHFLRHDQTDLAARFGGECSAEADKFTGLHVRDHETGAPVLADCAHWFVGRVLGSMPVDDHVVFALEPVASDGAVERGPLLGFQEVKDLDPGHDP